MNNLLDMYTMISNHIVYNLFPGLPQSLTFACCQAIANANEGDMEREIELPEHITFGGKTTCPTHALIDFARLESFLDQDQWEW